MKKFLKITAAIIVLLFGFGVVYYFINNEALPEGEKGKEADALATKCVSETQGGIIIPKVSLMRTANLIEVVDELNTHFSKMADTMYENEKIMAKNVVNAKNAKDAKAKRKEERLSQL